MDRFRTFRTKGWIGLGLSDTASMQNADLTVCFFNRNKTVQCVDGYSTNDQFLSDALLGGTPNITNVSGSLNDDLLTARFSKPLNATDRFEKSITKDVPIYVLFSYRLNGNPETEEGQIKPYTNFTSQAITLWKTIDNNAANNSAIDTNALPRNQTNIEAPLLNNSAIDTNALPRNQTNMEAPLLNNSAIDTNALPRHENNTMEAPLLNNSAIDTNALPRHENNTMDTQLNSTLFNQPRAIDGLLSNNTVMEPIALPRNQTETPLLNNATIDNNALPRNQTIAPEAPLLNNTTIDNNALPRNQTAAIEAPILNNTAIDNSALPRH